MHNQGKNMQYSSKLDIESEKLIYLEPWFLRCCGVLWCWGYALTTPKASSREEHQNTH
jgi:hypothetical protein